MTSNRDSPAVRCGRVVGEDTAATKPPHVGAADAFGSERDKSGLAFDRHSLGRTWRTPFFAVAPSK